MKIISLGDIGSTFSSNAYVHLAARYKAPAATIENHITVTDNCQIIPTLEAQGGYAVMAMDTRAGGRIQTTMESMMGLLLLYSHKRPPSFCVIGAVRLELHFCLIGRKGLTLPRVGQVLGHRQALRACSRNLKSMTVVTREVSSAHQAVLEVQSAPDNSSVAVLAPKSAAQIYGLKILNPAFEDQKAITTFFLLGPTRDVRLGKKNRALIVFRTSNSPGALSKALKPFGKFKLNLSQIHSMYSGAGAYDIGIELDLTREQIPDFHKAMKRFKKKVTRHLVFGPFEVFDKK